jgi:hypothetical protein
LTNEPQPEFAVFEHKALLINVNRSADKLPLYDATHYAWVVNPRRAQDAEVILAVRQGVIIGAFEPSEWLEATKENFPDRDPVPGRYGFKGREAPDDVARLYLNRRVPDEYRRPGAANPIKYTWK